MDDCSKTVIDGSAPSPECLASAANHIAHDLELFELAWSERDTRLGWSLWFVLARSLMDFFFSTNRYKDTVLATDFPADEPWEDLAKELMKMAEELPAYRAVRSSANKNVAHLTYERTNEDAESRTPPSAAIHRFIQGVAASWLNRLTPEARVWFGE